MSDVWYESRPMRSFNSPHRAEMNFIRLTWGHYSGSHPEPCVPYSRQFILLIWYLQDQHYNTIYATIRQTNNQSIRHTVGQSSSSGRSSLIVAQAGMEWLRKRKQLKKHIRLFFKDNTSSYESWLMWCACLMNVLSNLCGCKEWHFLSLRK